VDTAPKQAIFTMEGLLRIGTAYGRGLRTGYTPSMPVPSFEEIGFECNPFRALTPVEWARAAVVPDAARRAADDGGHLQILGESGYGKMTTLLALEKEIRQAGPACAYEYIPQGRIRFHTETRGLDVFLLDEAQRLSRGFIFIGNERNRLLLAAKAGVRLILGSHEDLTDLFRAKSLPLRTVRLHPPGAAELADILERRLELFARIRDRARFSGEAAAWLEEQFGGDLRTMEYFLYDFFQSGRPTGTIPSGSLQEALGRFTPPAAGP
jgi:chromosomal replication initiation ATPase DnaA